MTSPSLTRLRHLLLLSVNTSDAFILHTHRMLSTPRGIEATLKTLYYTLLLAHSQLLRLLTRRYEKLAFSIASKASGALLPGEALIATLEPPHLRLTEWCSSVRALGDAVEDFRLFSRMWGLVRIYAQAKTLWREGKRDPAIKGLVWMQMFTGAGFQVFENGAYLIRKGVLRGDKWAGREGRWWVISSRFWFADVMLEFLRLLRVRQLRYNEEFGAEKVDADDKEVKIQSKELEKRWWRELYANIGWLPSSVHWSFFDEQSSLVSEAWLGVSGMLPGVMALQDAWRESA